MTSNGFPIRRTSSACWAVCAVIFSQPKWDASFMYVLTGTQPHTGPYNVSERIPQEVEQLGALTTDNPSQQAHVAELRKVVGQRMKVLSELGRLQGPEAAKERETQLANLSTLGQRAMAMVQEMRDEEDNLLRQRQLISDRTYTRIRLILAAAFVLVVAALFVNFRRLWRELHERSQAEEAIRKLNVRLLQVQDSERRKVARELHDSIGQIFAAMKMNLSMLDGQLTLTPEARAHMVSEFHKLLEMGITETRTLSHLLHPPLLDELGLASAAQWLVDGFSQRSNIQVTLELPKKLERMTQETELALFRVLQEGLTNIHRHSGSKTATVRVEQRATTVTLTVVDRGLGMPLSILETFRRSSAGLGVGLAGMRERVLELGGNLDIDSDGTGTTVRITLPIVPVTAAISDESTASGQAQSVPAD
ncbi:MAG TPA: ATP-binding protein [Candidatus Acidoferrales bacterium]|jgi:signal transduction histidine kinase|nr:ATP-binding protein [Candidatus Acidoferrales bacterium]